MRIRYFAISYVPSCAGPGRGRLPLRRAGRAPDRQPDRQAAPAGPVDENHSILPGYAEVKRSPSGYRTLLPPAGEETMGAFVISDAQLRALTHEQRAQLARR